MSSRPPSACTLPISSDHSIIRTCFSTLDLLILTFLSSRIIRISLSPSSADSAPCLLATQFTATNVPSSTPQIPTGALLHPNRSSYDVPIEGPGSNVPLAGYLVDLLNPQYNLHPLFRIDQEEGALLSTGRHSSFETGTGRLKLRLVDVEREVDSKEEGREDEGRERQNRNFFNLFNGVLPRRSWPTPLLVHGGEEVGRGKGAVRGMMDWVTERGVRNLTEPVTVQEQGEADKIRVKGFRLQVKKMITSLPGAFPRPGPSNPLPPRRRGVGPNGGPAILFDGEERDPELDLPMRRDVAALRAGAGLGVGNREGGENQQSLVLNVPVEEEEDLGAEIRRSDGELVPLISLENPNTKERIFGRRGMVPYLCAVPPPLLLVATDLQQHGRNSRLFPRRALVRRFKFPAFLVPTDSLWILF